MAKTLRIDMGTRNGRPSPGKGNFKSATSAATHIPEEGGRKTPGGQYSSNKGGQGEDLPKYGIGAGKGTLAKGKFGTSGAGHGNRPHHGGTVPTGEHHQAGHRAPTTHEEFHKLGSGHWHPDKD